LATKKNTIWQPCCGSQTYITYNKGVRLWWTGPRELRWKAGDPRIFEMSFSCSSTIVVWNGSLILCGILNRSCRQGCQMVYFQTKSPNLGKFLRALDWKMLKYLVATRNI
jgi:hypothetical protein